MEVEKNSGSLIAKEYEKFENSRKYLKPLFYFIKQLKNQL